MKLLYNLAKNNDYNTFKDALMDEVGETGVAMIQRELNRRNNIDRYSDLISMVAEVYNRYTDEYNVTVNSILDTGKKGYNVEARQLVIYLINYYTSESFTDIASKLGKSHATILYSVAVMTERISRKMLLISDDDFLKVLNDAGEIIVKDL